MQAHGIREGSHFVAGLFTKRRMQKYPFCRGKNKRTDGYRWQSIHSRIRLYDKEDSISWQKRHNIYIFCHRTFYEQIQMT